MITENLSTLKIHKLTQEQYDRELEAGRIDPSALYLTPDEAVKIFVQNEEPTEVEEGALWVDLDEGESYSSIPYIGSNGNWFIGGVDSGRPSRGEDGVTPVKGVDYFDGVNGYTPVRGTDYWTEEDIAIIKSYVDDAILGGEW